MTTDEIRELGKKEIGWSRHVKLVGESSANNVLYHWMLGFTACYELLKQPCECPNQKK